MTRAILLAIALTFAAGTAVAQDRVDTEFTFEDEGVLGGRATAEGSRVAVPLRPMRETLVVPRSHFIGEMMHSVESL